MVATNHPNIRQHYAHRAPHLIACAPDIFFLPAVVRCAGATAKGNCGPDPHALFQGDFAISPSSASAMRFQDAPGTQPRRAMMISALAAKAAISRYSRNTSSNKRHRILGEKGARLSRLRR